MRRVERKPDEPPYIAPCAGDIRIVEGAISERE